MNLESKRRIVSCRLTAEEYERFRQLSAITGVRSVSELARVAISALLQHPAPENAGSLESRVSALEARIQKLSTQVRKLHGVEHS